MSIDPNKFGISKSLIDAVNEALKGGQVKIDKNHNGKIDGQDFKMLRKEENIDEKSVSKAQQHAAGAALATQRGEYDGGKKGGAINRMASMKTSELRKFAGTKTKGLPTHKEEVVDEGNADNKEKKNAAAAAVGAKNRDGQYLSRMNPAVADKIRGREKMSGNDRKQFEEVEQVDELSKATLGSYIKKAATDVATNSAATGRHAERSNKIADHQKKTGDYTHDNQRRKDSKTADKAFDKSWKRRQGINKATDKLTKEEVVDEAGMSRREAGAHWDANKTAEKKSDTMADYKNKTAYQKAALAAKKKVSEGVEQVDELSTDTYHSAAKKAAKRAMGDAQGRSGPIFKKYAGMANKFRDKGMSQEKKEKAMKEETLDEIQGTYGNGGNKKNLKIIHKGEVVKDYGTDTKPNKASRDKKAEKMKAYRADRDKHMEEANTMTKVKTTKDIGYKVVDVGPGQKEKIVKAHNWTEPKKKTNEENIDELSKNTLGNYALAGVRDIASRQYALGKGDKSNTGKLMNRRKGVDKAISKLTKEATENPMAKQLADKKAAIQKTIAQKKIQAMQSKANKQISAMKEGKGCSCMEGKKSMTCEVHGDNSNDKLGKEKIELNPPLRD